MLLQVKNIKKKFNGKEILKGIDFSMKEGEIKTIIGPSGAGKTTIIRIINSLEKLDNGNIIVGNEYLYQDQNGKILESKDKTLKRKIGLVFQDYNLFPHMTVLENIIESPVNILGGEKSFVIEKAREILKKLRLYSKENMYPYELSGGEMQRVAIARAIILEPLLICLDEPTSALDPENIGEIQQIIKDLSETGIGILVISHDMNFARKISDEILFLDNGKIIETLNKKNQFKNNNLRVKNFIN